MTNELLFAVLSLNMASFAVLTKIYFMLGALSERVKGCEKRIERLEDFTYAKAA